MDTKRCSSCKVEKALSDFSRKNAAKLHLQCKSCQKVHKDRHYRENRAEYMARARAARRVIENAISEIKKSPCVDCNKKYPPYVMDFDHLDPNTKVISVSGAIMKGWSLNKVLEEVKKCDLVCSNCHRERTHQRLICD